MLAAGSTSDGTDSAVATSVEAMFSTPLESGKCILDKLRYLQLYYCGGTRESRRSHTSNICQILAQ